MKIARNLVLFIFWLSCFVSATAQTKLQNLTPTTTTNSTDVIYVVINPSTTPADRKITVDNLFQSRNGNKSVTAFASLSAAITAIGSSQAVVEIPTTTTVSASLTSPVNVTLSFTGAGMVSVSSSQTFTINGPLQAPLRQVFTGSGTVKFGSRIGVSYPEWFGAAGDNATDDALPIQSAINAFKGSSVQHHPGIVEMVGGYAIGSTITISGNSITLRSQGWGEQNTTPYRGFIRALDSCESEPMVLITECWNTSVEQIRIIGNSSHKPSAGIELRSQNISHGLDMSFIRNVAIGSLFGYDSDHDANQFETGLLISGTVDGDTNRFENLHIVHCGIGIDLRNPNAGVTTYDTLLLGSCDIGFKCGSRVQGYNWNFGANTLDLELVDFAGRLSLRDVTSEGAGMFALMGLNTELYVDDLGFQSSATLNVGGVIIDADNVDARLTIRNGLFTNFGFSGTPKILVRSTGGSSHNTIRLENIKGLTKDNLDIATSGGGITDMRELFFHRPPSSSLDWGLDDHIYLTDSEVYSEGQNDFLSKVNVYGGPFKIKQLPTPTGLTVTPPVGVTVTTRGYRVSAISGTGETLACASVTVSGPAALDSTHYNMLRWNPVRGADGYKIYGRTNGSELLMATVRQSDTPADGSQVTSFKDTGALTPSGALPTKNTTGTIEALFPAGTQALPPIASVNDTSQGIYFDSTGIRIVEGNNILATFANGGGVTFHFAGPLIPDSAQFHWSNAGLGRPGAGIIKPTDGGGGDGSWMTVKPIVTSAAAPTIASASTIAPTTPIVFISGTTTISTITAPSPLSSTGGSIILIPTGLWATNTGGNIALATTAVVSKALILSWDVTTGKWYPSY
ncbi:MAG: hypothetical protein WBV94_20645 [Blastocatellia bacterium]